MHWTGFHTGSRVRALHAAGSLHHGLFGLHRKHDIIEIANPFEHRAQRHAIRQDAGTFFTINGQGVTGNLSHKNTSTFGREKLSISMDFLCHVERS